MNLQSLTDRFLQSCSARRLSPKTIRGYRDHLNNFIKFTGEIDVSLLAATHINEFIGWYSQQPGRNGTISPHSLSGAYSSIRRLLNWAHQQDLVTHNPIQRTNAPRLGYRLPNILTEEDTDRLLKCVSDHPRNRAIIMLLLDSGLRLGELHKLNLSNLNLSQQYVRVIGKGDREAIVPFGRRVRGALYTYIFRYRKPRFHNEEALFLNRRGERLEKEGLSTLIKRIFRSCGIQGRTHRLRHTFATRFLQSGGDIHVLQRILRHQDISTTTIYLALTDEDLLSAHARHSPVDNS